MKKVLSELHDVIIELENNNSIKEAEILDEVFIKIADRKNDWFDPNNPYQTPTRHQYTPLVDRNGNPTNSNDIGTYGNTKLDIRIRQSPAYSFFQDRYIIARDNYVKILNKFKNRDYQANKNDNDLRKLYKAEFDAAVQDWEDWFVSALIQVKDGQKSPGIPKRFLTNPTVKPEVQTKPIPKMQPKVQPETKPVSKQTTPQVSKNKTDHQTTTTVTTDGRNLRPLEINQAEVFQKAQDYLDQLKERMKTYGEQTWQAYTNMQFKVYGEDKTPGKQIYRLWQDMIDEYKQQQQTKPETPTVQNNNQKS